MAVDPKGADLKRLLSEDPGGPVVMLNLLRFASGKRDQYVRYVRGVRPFAEKYGAQIIYIGDGSTAVVAEPGQTWDAVLLVRYPTRLAFSRMVGGPRVPENHAPSDHRAHRSGAAGDHALDARRHDGP